MATSKELCVCLLLLISSVIAVSDINNLEERKKVDAEEGKILLPSRKNQVREERRYFCPTPTAPPHSTITGDDYEMGSKITVHCDPGYTLLGNRDVYCVAIPNPFQKMALWDNIVGHNPHCVPINSATDSPKNVKRVSDEEVPAPSYLTDMGYPKKPNDDHVTFPKEHMMNPVTSQNGEKKTLKFKTNNCYLKKEIGPCRARKPRFYFNSDTNQCELFHYGGCKGNENNFLSEEECMKKCRVNEAV